MDLNQLINKLDSIDKVNESEPMAMPTPMPAQEDPKPVMNVNMNAQGNSIKDLLQLLSSLDDNESSAELDIASEEDPEMEAYENEPEEKEFDIDYMVNKLAGGMNKPKDTYDVVSKGDNPMQKKHEDMVEHYRAELESRLREYKEK